MLKAAGHLIRQKPSLSVASLTEVSIGHGEKAVVLWRSAGCIASRQYANAQSRPERDQQRLAAPKVFLKSSPKHSRSSMGYQYQCVPRSLVRCALKTGELKLVKVLGRMQKMPKCRESARTVMGIRVNSRGMKIALRAAPRIYSVTRGIRGHRETKYYVVEPESGVIRLVSMSLSQICFQIAKIRKLTDTGQENMVKPAKYGRETTARRFVTLENHHCQQTKCLQASQACTMDEMQDMKRAAQTCQKH